MSIFSVGIYSLSDCFIKYYSKRGLDFCKSFSAIVIGMMHSCSCSTGAIATSIAEISGKGFSAADKQIRYLLSNIKFQVDDLLWRCYLKMIFDFLSEGGYIKTTRKIYIQLDFTTIDNDFLILVASIAFRGKAVPIYFTMRRYPKRKDMLNQIKMETAFIKGLYHCLSKKYQYVIVADRGFGNGRFITSCEQNNFHSIIRLQGDLLIENGKTMKLHDVKHSTILRNVFVPAWNRTVTIIVRRKGEAIWYLYSDMNNIDRNEIVREYARRFKIEKLFQDGKSSGFNIEKTKIRKYDKLKRLLFCMCTAQALMLFVGDILKHNHHAVKKTFPHTMLLISAFSSWQRDSLSIT
jgi:hypothetical protein